MAAEEKEAYKAMAQCAGKETDAMDFDDPEYNVKCEICNKLYKNQHSLNTHYRNKHQLKTIDSGTIEAKKLEWKKWNKMDFNIKVEDNSESIQSENDANESNNLFKCKICKRNYKSQQVLDNHCRSFHKMKIKDLNESLQSEDDTMDVNDGERLKCSMCPGRSWKNQASLDAHCRKEHNIYKRPVNLNESLQSEDDATDVNDGERLKCSLCPGNYKNQATLDAHNRKEHNIYKRTVVKIPIQKEPSFFVKTEIVKSENDDNDDDVPYDDDDDEPMESSEDSTEELDEDSETNPEKKQMCILYNTLIQLKDDDGFRFIEMFMEIPSRKEFPDYYVLIARPIDMTMIKNKIKNGFYKTVDEFISDARLMFNNCRQYNKEGSTIVEEANTLEKLLYSKAASLELGKFTNKMSKLTIFVTSNRFVNFEIFTKII